MLRAGYEGSEILAASQIYVAKQSGFIVTAHFTFVSQARLFPLHSCVDTEKAIGS